MKLGTLFVLPVILVGCGSYILSERYVTYDDPSYTQLMVGVVAMFVCILVLVSLLAYKTHSEGRHLKKIISKHTKELELEKAILTSVIDAIPDILFCKDLELKHSRVNKQFENLFQLSREDIIGKTDREILNLPEDILKDFREKDLQIINQHKMLKLEEIVIDADGTERTVETIKSPLILNDKPIGLLGIARDITERKEAERQILLASNAKTSFIANMSHEILTPMNSIVGFSELALTDEIPEETREHLQRIIENSNTLLKIVNDILDVSKIESGKMTLEEMPFTLQEVFDACQTAYLPASLEKGLKLHFHMDSAANNIFFNGDPTKIKQIFMNILSNAVKFTSMGTIRVAAIIKESSQTSRTIVFELSDSGIGMSEEQLNKILEPFAQADISIARRYGGTGLGLFIAKSFIEMMGGRLRVESTVGVGSKFSFEITFETVDFADSTPTPTLSADNSKPTFSGQVLVCEDNTMNQLVISEHLSRVGLEAVIAGNGLVGLDMVKERKQLGKKPFDLIFMDIHMPMMDGLEASLKIGELGVGTPIIALTANIMAADRETYHQHGMVEFMGKPFTTGELWTCLKKYLTPTALTDIPTHQETVESISDGELLHKLKEKFAKDNQTKFQDIMECISTNDVLQAHRIVHTLKSSAGLIGKPILQNLCAEIEELLKNEENKVPIDKWPILEKELKIVLEELAPMLVEKNNDIPALSGNEMTETFKLLHDYLQTRNPDCLQLLDALKTVPGSETLVAQIEAYDFRQALKTLKEYNYDKK